MNSHVLVAVLFVLSGSTWAAESNLSGTYRVRGECAYRAKNGDYNTCVAWNELKLKRLKERGEYEFNLQTNTFATTQGGCSVDGRFRIEDRGGKTFLVRLDDLEDSCHLQFQVKARSLVLEIHPSEEFTSCKSICGPNSTLYSDPFPRASKRK